MVPPVEARERSAMGAQTLNPSREPRLIAGVRSVSHNGGGR